MWEQAIGLCNPQFAWCNHVTVIESDRSGHRSQPELRDWCSVHAATWSGRHRNNLMASLLRRQLVRLSKRAAATVARRIRRGETGRRSTPGFAEAMYVRRRCQTVRRARRPRSDSVESATTEDEWHGRLTSTRKHTLLPSSASVQNRDPRHRSRD